MKRRQFLKRGALWVAAAPALILARKSIADVNFRNGIAITTASTINGKTPNSHCNGQTIVAGGGAATAFITSISGGADVFSLDDAGYKFTVGGAAVTVSELGAWFVAATVTDLTVRIKSNGGCADVATGVIPLAGSTVGQFNYVSITPVVLSSSTAYHITVDGIEYRGGAALMLGSTAVATINSSTDQACSATAAIIGAVDFKYTLP